MMAGSLILVDTHLFLAVSPEDITLLSERSLSSGSTTGSLGEFVLGLLLEGREGLGPPADFSFAWNLVRPAAAIPRCPAGISSSP